MTGGKMAVAVMFREKRLIYPDGVKWTVDPASGRLNIFGNDGAPIATYNTGVWDLVLFPPNQPEPGRRRPVPTLGASTTPNSVDAAWNSTLKPSTDVDFQGGQP